MLVSGIPQFHNKKFLYIFVTALIVLSDDCFWFSTANIKSLTLIKFIFILTLPCFLIKDNKLTIQEKNLLALVILTTISSGIVNGFAFGGPLLLCFIFLASFLIVNKISFSTFGKIFSNIIIFLSLCSIIVWGLLIFHILSPNIIENSVGVNTRTLLLCQFYEGYVGILRNAAIFREPGIFMIFINLAFLFDIYNKQTIPIYRLIIYTFAIFSTFSTAGYIILSLCFFLYFLKKGVSFRIIIPLILLLTGVYLFISSDSLMASVFGKLERGQESASVLGRISSITVPLTILSENPIFGVGTEDFRGEYLSISQRLFGIRIDPQGMSTNTFINAGALFGLFFFAFILIGYYKLSQIIAHQTITRLLVILSLLFIFSNESMLYSFIFIILLAYGYVTRS